MQIAPEPPPAPVPIVDWFGALDQEQLIVLVGALSAGILTLVLLFIVIRRLLRRPEPATEPTIDDRFMDISQLDPRGPPNELPVVEVYGVQVRIAVIVLAPVGRDGARPEPEHFNSILEQLVPGFSGAILRDDPIVKIWPGQLSTQGFTNAFFNNVALPGDRGKGTPWCALAGRFTTEGKSFLVGLVCCAAQSNALGQFAIQHEGQWNDVLRLRGRKVK